MTTFVATHHSSLPVARVLLLGSLVAKSDERFRLTFGDASRGQVAVALCFDGPREYADQAVIAEFRRICGQTA
jgi:hypothetical protein